MADSRILRTSLAGWRGPRPVWPEPPHHISCAVHRHAQTKQAQNGKTSRVLDGPLAGLLEAWGACQARLWEHAVAKSQHRHCKNKNITRLCSATTARQFPGRVVALASAWRQLLPCRTTPAARREVCGFWHRSHVAARREKSKNARLCIAAQHQPRILSGSIDNTAP